MANIIEKTKEIINAKQTPITMAGAKILAISGKVCSVEQRQAEFIRGINEAIIGKARVSQFRYLVEIPEDLIEQTSDIITEFKSRGFRIHTLEPKIEGIFVINWR